MPIADKQYPVRFTPKGIVDAFDATDKFPGACTSLQNLIFDPANPELVISRPGVTDIFSFTALGSYQSATVISAIATIGKLTFGMIGTSVNPGKDQPFIFNHDTAALVHVGNILGSNVPTSQAKTGPWTPPTIANVGVYVIVTHPGFAGTAGHMFGWFDITNPAAPTWNEGDTATYGLPSRPLAVANFNNRAYFACGNSLPWTDELSLNRTASTQALTLGDNAAITALSGLPVQTTSSGVVQALIAFKDFQCWQITGDAAASTLAENYLSLNVGCSAPRSIVSSPLGIYFASFFGPYIIDQFGILRAVVNSQKDIESDLQLPFLNTTEPSRIAAGYMGAVYRVCIDTLVGGTQTRNDYWFDERRRRWNGPHTFSYDCASSIDNYFVLVSNAQPGILFASSAIPGVNSVYTDNGANFITILESADFPKQDPLAVKQVVESTMELSSSGVPSLFQVIAMDDAANQMDACNVTLLGVGALWGGVTWGNFLWSATMRRPLTYTVPWTVPLVFVKMAIRIVSQSVGGLSYGTFFARYKKTEYSNVR